MKTRQLRPDDEEQSKKFIEKAREIGADKDLSATDLLLSQLAKTKPLPHSIQKTDKTARRRR